MIERVEALVCRPWFVGAVIATSALVAHLPILENDFVPFDDPHFVLLVPEVMGGLSSEHVAWAFTTTDQSNYFPLTRLSWMTDAQLFGRNAAGFHATSLLLHTANAVLLFFALLRLTREIGPSAFVAAVFAIHPLHVESIAWVSTRKDLLAGLFFALALLAHERRARSDHPRRWGIVLALVFALGLLSKPVIVTLPFLLLLLDVWPLRRWRRGEVAGLFREKAVLFALALAGSVLTLFTQQGAMASLDDFSLVQRLANATLAYLDYAERAVWPRDLAVLYPMSRAVGDRLWLAGAGLVLGSIFVVQRLHTRPGYFVGWFWFVGMLVPTIGLVQVGVQASADRYTYLSLAGLSLLAACVAYDRVGALSGRARRAGRVVLSVLALVWMGFLVHTTRAQAATWRDGRTLFEHAIAVTDDNVGAEFRLGQILHQQGDLRGAIAHYEKAARLAPTNQRIRGSLERARRDALAR